MKKIVFMLGIFALAFGMSACKSNSSSEKKDAGTAIATSDNSQNSLDWNGTYSGILPGANSEIETVITLGRNNTYTLSTRYIAKSDEVFTNEGSFKWSADGSTITLENLDKTKSPTMYKVGENRLIQLDLNGKPVTGDLASKYVLKKADNELVEKYWKLYEIMGEPIKEGDLVKDAHLRFKVIGSRVFGNGGCNELSGTYKVSDGNRIEFSQLVSTMMMCPNMEIEGKLKEVLEMADNYYAQNDTLVLNRARMAPLARFVAVYM